MRVRRFGFACCKLLGYILCNKLNHFMLYSMHAMFNVSEDGGFYMVQVSKRLENTARHFKRFGSFGFWGQLVCTVVSAAILSFSIIITGKVTSPTTFYCTAGGIAASFISVFWSFGYIRLSEKLRKTASDPSKVLLQLHRQS